MSGILTNPEQFNNRQEREVDDGYELRLKMVERLLRFLEIAKNIPALEGKSLEEVLGTEESRRRFIENLSPEQYQELLIGINGLFRNLDKEQWEMDGKTVVMGDPNGAHWKFPKFEDKPGLLALSLKTAKRMIRDGRDLKDLGLMLSSTITATHPFNDGNGRTSKFVLAAVNRGYNRQLAGLYKKLLSSTADNHGNLTNPGMLDGYLLHALCKKLGMANVEELYDEEPEELKEEYRTGYVEVLIDCIANPDKPEYQIETTDGSKDPSLLNFYKQEIKSYSDSEVYKQIFGD